MPELFSLLRQGVLAAGRLAALACVELLLKLQLLLPEALREAPPRLTSPQGSSGSEGPLLSLRGQRAGGVPTTPQNPRGRPKNTQRYPKNPGGGCFEGNPAAPSPVRGCPPPGPAP